MKTKILVIEDDTAISELICMNLEAAGYDPVPIYDGEEAETAVLAEKDMSSMSARKVKCG